MALTELMEACRLLSRMPLLWIPGIVGGFLASLLWLVFIFTGAFFAGRLIIIFGLVLVFFLAGMYAFIREEDSGDLRSLLSSGRQQYFRVLLPYLVVIFMILLVFVLLVITLSLIGAAPDPSLVVFLSFGVFLPSALLTFFADVAAVFEDRKVFDALQRSIELVSVKLGQVIVFFVVSALVVSTILFTLMVIWEAALYAKLEPITRFTEEQLRAFTPEQLMALIGTDGVWVTAAVIFLAGLVLIPLLCSFKACFFRKLAGSGTIPIQQMTGEYDSKGRWYKY